MRKSLLFLMVTMLLVSGSGRDLQAQARPSDPAMEIIQSGMDAYKMKGPEEAMKAWIKGSPIDGSKEALSQANNLRQVQDYYGTFVSFDLIRMKEVTARIRHVYIAMNYEKSPLFADFQLYRSEQGWVLTSLNFNTKQGTILPDNLLP